MIELLYQKFLESPIISTDSRNVPAGAMFFALKGDNFDGNRFAQNALDLGASVAVIDDPLCAVEGCILVDNALSALQQLAAFHRKKLGLKVIGITGSNGKTTTKELLAAVLAQKYNVYATKGNLNNHIGVPLTLLALTKDTEIAIVEMGANHPGDIKELVEIADPDFGLITNIGRAHLGGFGSFEGVINTKGELYEFIANKAGKVFYNQSNSILSDLISKYKLETNSVPYSKFCKDVEVVKGYSNPYLSIHLNIEGAGVCIESLLVGDYNTENVISAITLGKFFGVDTSDIKNAIETYAPTNNRSQFITTQKNTVIMDAYNANPSSMELAIRNFSLLEGGSKVLILGEMLELGDYSLEEHQRIVELLADLNFAKVLLVGEGFREVHKRYEFFPDSNSCHRFISDNPIVKATVLLKGSRGVKLEKLMELL